MSSIMRGIAHPSDIQSGNVVELSTGDVRAVTDVEFDRHMGEWSFLGEDDYGNRKFYTLAEQNYHIRYLSEPIYASA